jgi:hypothetical protein
MEIKINKKFWEELIAYFPLIHVEQFFYCCVCIRCRRNVFAKPLLSKDTGLQIQTYRAMGGIYKISRWDGLMCHDTHTHTHTPSFIKIGSDVQKLMEGEIQRHTNNTDVISLLLYAISVLSVCVCSSVITHTHINFWIPEPVFMKLDIYIMGPVPISEPG